MSTDNNTTTTNGAVAAQPPKKQQPSLYARKLLQKLSTLNPNASLESRQTIASWMVFNRKKCEGMGEGLLLSIDGASGGGPEGGTSAANLMLLLRILHQVLLSNCPTITPFGTTLAEVDTDKWEKSSQLRTNLSEIVMIPLFKAIATSLNKLTDENTKDQYSTEIKGMMDDWKEHDVFGGPTILEEYKKAWVRAVKDAARSTPDNDTVVKKGEDMNATNLDEDTKATSAVEETSKAEDIANEETPQIAEEPSVVAKDDTSNNENNNANDIMDKKEEAKDGPDKVSETTPNSSAKESDEASKGSRRTSKRDSIASVDIEVDFEGVEEAKVEPTQFLEACKVIQSIQIARDLGSDAAMNISSAFSNISPEVEEACNTILMQQKKGEDETPITELVSSETLSNLPDDLLDMDLKYAKQSLQTYKDSIRQQRKARLQCLHLLLQSRCSFGSMDAARVFCGGDGTEISMDTVLEQLKKRKEVLVDALALEGLDVEEDAEEKKNEKEGEALKPPSWFPGQSESEEPAAKKLKSV